MNNKTRVLIVILSMIVNLLFGQESLTLAFLGQRGDGCYQKMDYLSVRNTTRDWQETLYYPDTTFIINSFGSIENINISDLINVIPNLYNDEFRIEIEVPTYSHLIISTYEISGAMCVRYQSKLTPGSYAFTMHFSTSNLYLLSVSLNHFQYTTKIFCHGGNGNNQIELISFNNMLSHILDCDSINHPFEYGDIMEYIGYVNHDGLLESSNRKIQPQYNNEDIILHFDALLPELKTDTVGEVTQTTATCVGEVSYDGGAGVTERGICWSINPEPTIDNTHSTAGQEPVVFLYS